MDRSHTGVFPTGDTIVLESIAQLGLIDQPEINEQLWVDTIQCEQYGPDQAFRDEWIRGNLVLVSDGSSKKPIGTGAWILTSKSLFQQNILI